MWYTLPPRGVPAPIRGFPLGVAVEEPVARAIAGPATFSTNWNVVRTEGDSVVFYCECTPTHGGFMAVCGDPVNKPFMAVRKRAGGAFANVARVSYSTVAKEIKGQHVWLDPDLPNVNLAFATYGDVPLSDVDPSDLRPSVTVWTRHSMFAPDGRVRPTMDDAVRLKSRFLLEPTGDYVPLG